MANSYTKARLIAEIAASVKLSKADVTRVLDSLTELAYREAVNGFVVPGICKLKVIDKKASKRRNPITGQTLLIGERKSLKIVALKKAKSAIAPNPNVLVQVLDAPPPAPVPEKQQEAPAEPSAVPPATAPSLPPLSGEEGQIIFPCPECGSMLAASPRMAGQDGDCPFCGGKTHVPDRTADVAPESAAKSLKTESLSDFVLFVCRACGQEIEAPIDMIGMDAECPTCGSKFTVPMSSAATGEQPAASPEEDGAPRKNRSSMTIRIDLSDLE